MRLYHRIEKHLESRNKTLGVARQQAQNTATPYVVRIYLGKDLGIERSPSRDERKQVKRYLQMKGWSDIIFDDPSANQMKETIVVLIAEPMGWPGVKIRRILARAQGRKIW